LWLWERHPNRQKTSGTKGQVHCPFKEWDNEPVPTSPDRSVRKMPYFLAPMIGWFVSGCLKYLINSIRFGRHQARDYAGNGGFPSTHTSTIATVTFLIGF